MIEKKWLSNGRLGYSLVELLVVMMIIGLLAIAGLSAYERYATRTYRSGAQVGLHKLAVSLNTFKLEHFGQGYIKADQSAEVIQYLEYLNKTTTYAFDVSIDSDGNGFFLSATPKANSTQAGDGLLTLNHIGLGCWYENNDEGSKKTDQCHQGRYW